MNSAFFEAIQPTRAPHNETVMVAPADGFYVTAGAGRDEVRIAYVLSLSELERAMNVIREALASYPGAG